MQNKVPPLFFFLPLFDNARDVLAWQQQLLLPSQAFYLFYYYFFFVMGEILVTPLPP